MGHLATWRFLIFFLRCRGECIDSGAGTERFKVGALLIRPLDEMVEVDVGQA